MSGGLAPASSRSAFSRGIGSGGVVGSPPGITVSVDSRGGASSGAAANAGSAQGAARVHRPTLTLSRPAGTAPPSSALAPASSAETWRGASPAAAAGSPAPDASDSAPVLAPARAPLLRSRYVRISEALLFATLVLVVATVGLLIWCVLSRVRRAGRCSGTGSLEQTAVRCRDRRASIPRIFLCAPSRAASPQVPRRPGKQGARLCMGRVGPLCVLQRRHLSPRHSHVRGKPARPPPARHSPARHSPGSACLVLPARRVLSSRRSTARAPFSYSRPSPATHAREDVLGRTLDHTRDGNRDLLFKPPE